MPMNQDRSGISRRDFVAMTPGVALWPAAAASAMQKGPSSQGGQIRAGAHTVDITPTKFPVIVNGGFLAKKATAVTDPIHARCLVLEQGDTRIALVVVDICVMPRELLDEAKALARKATGIPAECMMISATHTHSAPSVMGALGTPADPNYPEFLVGRLARCIELAAGKLAPARVGWGAVNDFEHTRCRRWITRTDRLGVDPFGEKTIHAMMHPRYRNPDYVGPAGPIDPGLSILSVQSPRGRPIALLANYSQHYYGGVKAISADYYGRFVRNIEQMISAGKGDPPFVAMISQGTSGDLHWMDYTRPPVKRNIDAYAEAVARVAFETYKKIEHHEAVPLAMAEKKLTLPRRVPDAKRLAWAGAIVAGMKGREPKNRTEVYAREQVYLHAEPTRELKLQAIRIGELGIAAMSCEVFGLTGLKIKGASPLPTTFNIELANGEDGYIPPPEQHALGGYTTWPARTAGLEVQAEPKIVEAVLQLLEKVSGRRRRKIAPTGEAYAKMILRTKPASYWRLAEMKGPRAVDATGRNHGTYESGVAFYLPGHDQEHLSDENVLHRAAHFAGGRMKAVVEALGGTYSVDMWFWNGIPADTRAVAGYVFSRAADGVRGAMGDNLGISGRAKGPAGKLLFYNGDKARQALLGKTAIPPRTWNHVVLVRAGRKVAAYLNGKPDISGEAGITLPGGVKDLFVGGRADNMFNFEGKIDEVAVYARALSAAEVARHYKLD